MQTLRDVIDHHAEANPDAPFLFAPEPGTTITYRELRDSGRALAGMLQGEAIAPGEVVSFMLPNGVSAAALFLGTMYAGRVVSALNLIARAMAMVNAVPDSVEALRRFARVNFIRLGHKAHLLNAFFRYAKLDVT